MNKADLIAELADRMDGDVQRATDALENTLDIIVRKVAAGESITVMGFGIFEKRARAARVARNPHTGETIPVPPTYTPAFRPGQYFKAVVQGEEELPEGQLAAKRSSSHQAFGSGRSRAKASAGSTTTASRATLETAARESQSEDKGGKKSKKKGKKKK